MRVKYKIGMALVICFAMVFSAISVIADDDLPPLGENHIIEPGQIPSYAKISVYKNPALPSEFDWRDRLGQNWVTPAKDQQSCGSCWAFASTGALEANLRIFYYGDTRATDLSEQYLVSCDYDPAEFCEGCDGGTASGAFMFLMNQGTIWENDFQYVSGAPPYIDITGTVDPPGGDFGLPDPLNYPQYWLPPCPGTSGKVKIKGWGYAGDVPNWYDIQSADDLKEALMAHGPLYFSFHVWESFMDFYLGSDYGGDGYEGPWGTDKDGNANVIYTDDHINDPYPSQFYGGHAVLLVGWVDDGANPNGPGYWILKNSWGPTWGPYGNGYFCMEMNMDPNYLHPGAAGAGPEYGFCGQAYNNAYLKGAYIEFPFAAIARCFCVVASYRLGEANALLVDIEELLPDEVPEDVQALLDEAQEHIDNANKSGVCVYANKELMKAMELLEQVKEKL